MPHSYVAADEETWRSICLGPATQTRRIGGAWPRAHGLLRAPVVDGDGAARIARLLSELLRLKGLTKGQRIALRLEALQNLVHALRSVASMTRPPACTATAASCSPGTRLLDLAIRDHVARSPRLFQSRPGRAPRRRPSADPAGDLLVRGRWAVAARVFPATPRSRGPRQADPRRAPALDHEPGVLHARIDRVASAQAAAQLQTFRRCR